ncbi:LuxR C-terminal-related transcriptional regulator [Dactylosporangium salmoneum]|uniref:HTH luxR-type domain-containing protein n=1 Tax=Dactylosporangium salmoneum TaxID=53361 RepID=A0ABP5V369_9ACTN
MLELLGLNARTEAVYRAMLGNRSWGIRQIADHLELTNAQVKAALDQLAELSLLTPASTEPGEWHAVHPAIGLSALLARAEAEVSARRRQIDDTRAAILAIAAQHTAPGAGADDDAPRRLVGVDAVRRRMLDLSAAASRECLSLNPTAAQTTAAKTASKPLNQQMLERGVAIRCIYQESFRNEPHLVAEAKWLTALGGEMYTVPIVPLLMVIYDRSTVLLPIDPADTQAGALEVRSPGLVRTACALFDQLLAVATPFGAATLRDEQGLDPLQRQLLALLAAGHTDGVVARRLGVSLSTVRRLMATLMERLEARSRFQAGLHVEQRGWLRQTGEQTPRAAPSV